MTGPERDPLAANEDRLGAIRAKLSGVGPGFMLDIRLSKDERDIILRALDDSYALTDADSRAEAAETRYAALAETIDGSGERVSNAMMQLNVLFGQLDEHSFKGTFAQYHDLMEHLKTLRDDLSVVGDAASLGSDTGEQTAGRTAPKNESEDGA